MKKKNDPKVTSMFAETFDNGSKMLLALELDQAPPAGDRTIAFVLEGSRLNQLVMTIANALRHREKSELLWTP